MIHVTALLRLIILSFVLFSCSKKESQEIKPSQQVADEYDVSLELASRVAKNFSNDEAFLRHAPKENSPLAARLESTEAEKELKKVVTYTDDNGSPAVYIVNLEPEGFILVSATKKEVPILAYSDQGHFEINKDTLAGVKEWLVERKTQIQTLKASKNTIVSKQTQDLWDAAAPPSDGEIVVSGGIFNEQVGPLLKTKWNQNCGYNALLAACVSGGVCNKVYTGCVATAAAQIMYYWKKPTSYNWSIMPLNIDSIYSGYVTTQMLETAKLMRDVGTLVGMNYGCSESGAQSSAIRDVLVNNYGYSPSAVYTDFNIDLIQIQIYNKKPVVLRGDGSGGHCWITDGIKRNHMISIHNPGTIYEYQTDSYTPNYLRMNWGWGGSCNGWYIYNNFNPGWYNFNNNKKMIINIQP